MAWNNVNRRKLREALQDVYLSYTRLEIFVHDELDASLQRIVPSSQDMEAVAFKLVEWARTQRRLDDLYKAFREENPEHPFLIQVKPAREINTGKQTTRAQINQEKSLLPGEAFTFTTASITSDGIITERQKQGRRQVFDLGGTPLEMVWIPTGSFLMGSPKSEPDRRKNEGPQHQVTFAEGFWMGRYPVTQAQWGWIARSGAVNQSLIVNPRWFLMGKYPVDHASWDGAQEFCRRLSREFPQEFKLPSEAQWEYACRAGTATSFAFGDRLPQQLAHYGVPCGGATEVVGQFLANGWGLHGMHGNVWEWCEDTWHGSYDDAPNDGTAWIDDKSVIRSLRGGSWFSRLGYCRSAFRSYSSRGRPRLDAVGFRVCCVAPQGL
ncbi:MAG: SUMF1/EgtB/PvdO family nonheme iron enzyme [Cyanobacteria bacterium P01_F01_bin.153]